MRFSEVELQVVQQQVVVKDETVERRAITLGAMRGGDVQVLAGLSGGEQVALGDLAKLADGVRIKIQE